MNAQIQRHQTGQSVYGVKQYEFSDGEGGENLDLGSLVSQATLKQAAIVEDQTKAVAAVLKIRQRKTADLGSMLAFLDKVLTRFRTKDQESGDKGTVNCSRSEVDSYKKERNKLEKEYGYDLVLDEATHKTKSGCKEKPDGTIDLSVSRGDAMKGQARIQEMLDTESNSLQQDMMSLQGFMQKRDKTFSAAADVMKKFEKTAGDVIKTMND